MTKQDIVRILRCDGSKDFGILKLALINVAINGDENLNIGAYDFYFEYYNRELSIIAMYDCVYQAIFSEIISDSDIDWELKQVSQNLYNKVEKTLIDFLLRVGAVK